MSQGSHSTQVSLGRNSHIPAVGIVCGELGAATTNAWHSVLNVELEKRRLNFPWNASSLVLVVSFC